MNAWLYSTHSQTKVDLDGGAKEQQTLHIKGVGILKIKPGCTAYVDDTKLWRSPIIKSAVPNYMSPKISLKVELAQEE